MIFATDLDRTMIYSKRFLENAQTAYQNIEIYKEEPISYISLKALNLLKELKEIAPIVPVTTRNYEQYHRIEVFKGVLEPQVYIINNGGTIYYQNQEDKEWTLHIQNQIEALEVGYEEVLESFLADYKGPVERYKKSDDLIWLILGDKNQIDWEAVEAFKMQYEDKGWNIDVNERKIYLYPECINKWAAIQYVKECYYGNSEVAAAGDSLFDFEMVHEADYGFVPKAAWIEAECQEKVYITQKEGLEAAEEILLEVLKKAGNHKKSL